MAFMAIIRGLGLLFYILLGFRLVLTFRSQGSGSGSLGSSGASQLFGALHVYRGHRDVHASIHHVYVGIYIYAYVHCLFTLPSN